MLRRSGAHGVFFPIPVFCEFLLLNYSSTSCLGRVRPCNNSYIYKKKNPGSRFFIVRAWKVRDNGRKKVKMDFVHLLKATSKRVVDKNMVGFGAPVGERGKKKEKAILPRGCFFLEISFFCLVFPSEVQIPVCIILSKS